MKMSEEKTHNKLPIAFLVAAIFLAVIVILHFKKQDTATNLILNEVVKNARMWRPEFTSWFGKTAPDMTITDISGKKHSLKDYRGKNVILVFWATWCGPCIMEIPHLNALRSKLSEDKLIILAISNEPESLVKKFAVSRKISYNVFSVDSLDMPSPFSDIEYLPSSFFIDPNGIIKLATTGTLNQDDMEAIIRAEK